MTHRAAVRAIFVDDMAPLAPPGCIIAAGSEIDVRLHRNSGLNGIRATTEGVPLK